MTTIVSAFISNVNSNRNIENYIEYGKKLCSININKIIFIEEHIYNTYFKNEIFPLTIFIFISKEQLYFYQYKKEDLTNFNKLQTDNPMIIDYANLYRTDFGDAFLPANCDFFLGNTAGIFLVSTIFNINSAVANYAPLDITPFLRNDIYLPKYLNMPLSQQLEISIEIMEKNPPPLVPSILMAICEAAGPWAIVCSPPSTSAAFVYG